MWLAVAGEAEWQVLKPPAGVEPGSGMENNFEVTLDQRAQQMVLEVGG